ncbi:sugar phosphate isomerase/epimerase [Paenibacillus sp. GYB004]|uniref:sugar phosphate isomerase/epimerase family protein n=1 Tax=Paenibacillus sp. GYB004 TaxID=2994393 RepID=UPI002F9684CE
MKIKGFSTNMYGWQDQYWQQGKDAPWEELFRKCRESGIDAVELDPTTEVLKLAKAQSLSVSGAYVGLLLHEPFEALRVEESVLPLATRVAEAGGVDLVINANPKGGWSNPEPKTEEEFKRQGDNLSRIADAVAPLGLKVSMHNHTAERHNADGDLRSVIDYASPEVGLCIDTGWAYVAGHDPIEYIRQYPEKLYAFHLRNMGGALPTEDLLEGDIDMRALIHELAHCGYDGWLTFELLHHKDISPKRTMIEDVRRSVDYLKKLIAETAN